MFEISNPMLPALYAIAQRCASIEPLSLRPTG